MASLGDAAIRSPSVAQTKAVRFVLGRKRTHPDTRSRTSSPIPDIGDITTRSTATRRAARISRAPWPRPGSAGYLRSDGRSSAASTSSAELVRMRRATVAALLACMTTAAPAAATIHPSGGASAPAPDPAPAGGVAAPDPQPVKPSDPKRQTDPAPAIRRVAIEPSSSAAPLIQASAAASIHRPAIVARSRPLAHKRPQKSSRARSPEPRGRWQVPAPEVATHGSVFYASILAVAPPSLAPHRTGPANSNGALLPAALALFLLALAAGSLLRLAARLPTTPGWR